MSSLLLISHSNEDKPDDDPVEVINDYGAIRCGVAPAEDGVKNTPTAATTYLWRTALGTIISTFDVLGH
jgi:hypothetical protein